MKVLIYGGGAVGLGIASCLLKAGAGVDIVARESTVAALRTAGLARTGIFGEYHAAPSAFACCTSLNEIPESAYNYILVCIKSFDSSYAAQDIARHKVLLDKETKIVLFQNGWGNAEVFSSFFDRDIIYSARVITGFRRPKNNEVTITVHADSIHIGSLFTGDVLSVEDLCRTITKGDIPCESTESIEKDLWAKMLYNCALNGLGAILNVCYGDLAECEFSRTIMNNIVEEVFRVMSAAGYRTHWDAGRDFLEVFYKKLVPDTAEHSSSTLQDILAGKKTEIDALNGAVIVLANKYGISVPHNLTVYFLVKSIEAGVAARSSRG